MRSLSIARSTANYRASIIAEKTGFLRDFTHLACIVATRPIPTEPTRSTLDIRILQNKARNGRPKAQATAAELMGNYLRRESWEAMFSLCAWDKGWKVPKEKMAST